VYLSDLLPRHWPGLARTLTRLLEAHRIGTALIPGTWDVWCCDYMPIQIDVGRFVQFRCAPSYLRGGYEHLITPPEVARAVLNGTACASSSIVLN
jgi:hypothetical protein